jgi:hypothetical protein
MLPALSKMSDWSDSRHLVHNWSPDSSRPTLHLISNLARLHLRRPIPPYQHHHYRLQHSRICARTRYFPRYDQIPLENEHHAHCIHIYRHRRYSFTSESIMTHALDYCYLPAQRYTTDIPTSASHSCDLLAASDESQSLLLSLPMTLLQLACK